MSSHQPTPGDRARWNVWDKVREIAVLLDGDEVMIERPSALGPGHVPVKDVEPLAGVRAALFVQRVAQRRMLHYAEQARADGVSWAHIGEALGLAEEAERTDTPLGEAASVFVFQGLGPRIAAWTCGSCVQRITDYGPFDGHPGDCEHGHAEDCQRHHAEIADYQKDSGR